MPQDIAPVSAAPAGVTVMPAAGSDQVAHYGAAAEPAGADLEARSPVSAPPDSVRGESGPAPSGPSAGGSSEAA